MSLKKAFLSLMLLTHSLTANAAILDLGTITRDTSTGLDWLDVTETRYLSYSYVSSQFGIGGAYEGWRYATTAEWEELVSNFGYSPVDTNCGSGLKYCDNNLGFTDNPIITTIIRTVGDTHDALLDENNDFLDIRPGSAGYTIGILAPSLDPYSGMQDITVSFIRDLELVERATGIFWGDGPDRVSSIYISVQPNSIDPEIGSYLVRASEIPIPTSGLLFGSLLLTMVSFKRWMHK